MIYLFLLAHLVADFMLQPYWLVVRKQRWSGLLMHCAIVLACMLLLPVIDQSTAALWPAMLAITAVHLAADRWKVRYADTMLRPPIVPFLIDQAIHTATIAGVLGLLLPPARLWSLAGSPFAHLSARASVYVIAACAAPIAVMICMDPSFTHVALAGRARMRSLCIGAAVVWLTLTGGVLALPATLIGFAVVSRHPVSSHPLDTPAGRLAVLMVAATLAALLVLLQG